MATVPGEHDGRLLGGQKQRIASILIFDEATSALDSDSHAFIPKALQKLMIGRTTLIIAHRFSTIRDTSMILVFEEGRFVASGPHKSVYDSSPMYRSLYDKQTLPS